MSKPFDATLKHLLEAYPQDWLRLVGLRNPGRVEVADADLSTVSSAADKVFRVSEPTPWFLHLELQASYDAELAGRMLRYNVLIESRHKLPVQSVAILLRPEADGNAVNGRVERRLPNRKKYLDFKYDVVRVWQLSPEAVSHVGLGTLPLLPLTAVSRDALPAMMHEIGERFSHESEPDEAASLWTATYILMGLKYSKEYSANLLVGVRAMKESVTYQAILEEGEAKGIATGRRNATRDLLLFMGTKRFGKPKAKVYKQIESISDVSELKRLTERLLDVSTWDELLGES